MSNIVFDLGESKMKSPTKTVFCHISHKLEAIPLVRKKVDPCLTYQCAAIFLFAAKDGIKQTALDP